MGTLIFHILLFSFFLLAEVDMKGNVREEPLLIEFPDMPVIEEKTEVQPENSNNVNGPSTTNAASNRLSKSTESTASTEKFFDNEFQKELSDAKKMVSDVNSQLAKEKISLDKIKMPVQTTEGMNPDSIKNVIFTGESNIVYYLDNRYHTSLPIPVYLTQGGGKIVVDIQVDRNGNVTKATPRNNNQVRDELIMLYAQTAAERTKFNADPSAPAQQKGTIHYTFIAQ
ncbi:MAG TPA: hypothetical protein VN182_08030 [Flavobacterium sp.]|nr:hypothetical protein [Flavobacterium sp.]